MAAGGNPAESAGPARPLLPTQARALERPGPLIAVLLAMASLGAALRSWGADFPSSFHPDESVYVSYALRMATSGDFRPGWYEHATLHLTTLAALYRLLGIAVPDPLSPEMPPAEAFFVARRLAMVCSLAQIPLVYVLGRMMSGARTGILAALAFALVPLDVWESHFGLNNQMVSLFMLIGLIAALRVARSGRGYLLAAGAAGLAQATRHTGVFVMLCLVLAHAMWLARARASGSIIVASDWPKRGVIAAASALVTVGVWGFTLGPAMGITFHNLVRSTGPLEEGLFRLGLKSIYTALGPILAEIPLERMSLLLGASMLMLTLGARWLPDVALPLRVERWRILRAGGVALLVFVLAMPWIVLDSDLVMSHLKLQVQLNAEPRFGFDRAPAGWQYRPWVYEVTAGLPFSLGLAFYALALVGSSHLIRHRTPEGLLVLTFLVAYIGFLGLGSRVFLRYLVPALPALCVIAAAGAVALMGARAWSLRVAGRVAVGVAFGFTLWFTVLTTQRFAPDTRLLAAQWIDAQVPIGESLGMNTIPELSPPVDPRRYPVVRYDRAIRAEWVDPIIYMPRYLVVTSAIYNRALRDPRQYDFYLDSYHRLWAGDTPYALVARWDSPLPLADLYTRLDPMFAAYYVSPTIEVYRR